MLRWNLLASASMLVLVVAPPVNASEQADRPQLWIEIGGDLNSLSGLSAPFTPNFTRLSPAPEPYGNGNSPIELQKPSHFAFGGEGALTFQPDSSSWKFSVGVKYGRSNKKRDAHRQTSLVKRFPNPGYEHLAYFFPSYVQYYPSITPNYTKYATKLAETTIKQSESHLVLDFQAGKDVGLGLFGSQSTSTISGGVRVARFQFHTDVQVRARPDADFYAITIPNLWGGGPHASYVVYEPHWRSYYLRASADRSFNGIGPSLAWTSSVSLAGNIQKAEIELDWGINGSILFGKQKAKVNHHTTGREFKPKYYHTFSTPNGGLIHDHYQALYPAKNGSRDQSHSVTVPNLGGFAAVSLKFPNAKISLGYRADFFFGAMDTGIDAARSSPIGFHGPYASVSVGLGG